MMNSSQFSPVVLIGLDSATPVLIEKWIQDGSLPNLKKLWDKGTFGQIGLRKDSLVDIPWVTFFTGVNQAKYGAYHYLQWNPEENIVKRISDDWIPLHPFWQRFQEGSPRTITINIPHSPEPRNFNGIEVIGWTTPDIVESRSSYPTDLISWAESTFDFPPISDEQYKLFTPQELLKIRDTLINHTEKTTQLVTDLIKKESWDLLMVVFTATHAGGHKLWGKSNLVPNYSKKESKKLQPALKDIYISCDHAIGEIVALLPPETTILICSLHSMDINHSRSVIMPDIIEKIVAIETKDLKTGVHSPKLLNSLRKVIPTDIRHIVKERLPNRLQDRLTSYWRLGGINWKKTPVFALPGGHEGYVQVNLKGREKYGIVSPGEEFSDWLSIISQGIASFKDADTGESFVEIILRKEELGLVGEFLKRLPDLVVRFTETPAADHRALVSEKYGTVPWPTPGKDPEGRSGSHRGEGFILATGPSFHPNSHIENMRIIDLAPTILHFLGVPKFPEMDGKAIKNTKKEA